MSAPDRKLRVLLVTESSSAGVGRHVVDLAAGLLASGCRVDVIFSGHRMDDRFATQLPGLPGIRFHRIDMRRGPHPSDWFVVRDLQQYIDANGPFDVVHLHSSKAGIVGRLVRNVPRQSIVYTPHCIYSLNPDSGRLANWITRHVELRLATRSAATIAVSRYEYEHLIASGFSTATTHTIANGIDVMPSTNRSSVRSELGLHDSDVAIGFIGRLTSQKDPCRLIACLPSLKNTSARLVLVGEGPLDRECRALAQHLGIEHRIVWAGYRTAAEAMPAFDLLALSSRYEALPYVLLEGLAAALPIVATDVGGVGETVTDGENGFVVDGPGSAAMADALRSLAEQPAVRARFAAASAARAKRFSVARMVRQTHAVYQSVAPWKADSIVTPPSRTAVTT